MKKIILPLFLMLSAASAAFAQCDKKMVLTSSKTEYLNGSYEVQETKDEKIVVEYGKSDITIINDDNQDEKLTGTVSSYTCDWKTPLKAGKTILKAVLVDKSGDVKKVTITIEGKDGKVTFLGEMDDDPGRKIRVTADKFEEKS